MEHIFKDKWKDIKENQDSDEKSLFVLKGKLPKTQRQINLYWYHKFYETIVQGKNYKNALELGCGRGTLSLYLNKYNNLDVSLLDMSADAIDVAKKNFMQHNAVGNFFISGANSLPFNDNSFDIVHSIGLLEHIDNYKDILKEAIRVLKPGGVLISLNIPTKWSIQRINNLYKWFVGIFTGNYHIQKDYHRNNDGPEEYLKNAKDVGFKDAYVVNVCPLPIFVPISIKTDKKIAKVYNFIIKVRSFFMRYPFKTNYSISQGHFLVAYKK